MVEWEGGAKQKEMIISPYGSFLGMKGITYELHFFPEANDIFNEIKIGHLKAKKISKKKIKVMKTKAIREIKFCHVAKFSSGRN